jgi:hypothetical protein
MTMVVSLAIRGFIAAILLILVIGFLYKFIRSFLVDRTFAQDTIMRWQRRVPRAKGPVYFENAVGGFYITLVFTASSDPDATRERLRALCEYLTAAIPDKKFEILCFIAGRYWDDHADGTPLHTQFPSVWPIHDGDGSVPIQLFTFATLRARGEFVINADYIETELPKLPSEPNEPYVSAIDPLAPGGGDAILIVAAAKKAALALVKNVHVAEFGLATEIRLLAHEKSLTLNVERRRVPACDHATGYWIVDWLAAIAVRSMYDRKLWLCR